jgi:hypothetical protein
MKSLKTIFKKQVKDYMKGAKERTKAQGKQLKNLKRFSPKHLMRGDSDE